MAEDNEVFIEDDAVILEDTDNSVEEDADTSKIIPFIMERYHRAEDYRRQDEERWLRAYRNYRGIYGPEVQFTEAEKSRVFIKVTKTKTLAAYGQIADVLKPPAPPPPALLLLSPPPPPPAITKYSAS